MTDEARYPEALLRCGAPHGDHVCAQTLVVKLSLSDNAIYMCNRGHRLGEVSDVDAYLMAVILGAVSKPWVRQRFSTAMHFHGAPATRRALSDWWDDASPRDRHDLMITAIDRVLVTPSSMFETDSEPVVTVEWNRSTPSAVDGDNL
jgi:hypothetical protein